MRQSPIRLGAVHMLATVTFCLMACREVDAVTTCFVVPNEDSLWRTIERMGSDQLIGTLLLVGLLVTMAIVGFRCLRAIASAVKQSRAYESRALTALYFNHVDEAINAADSFPGSPVAAVVRASFQCPASYLGLGVNFGKPNKPAFHRALIAQTDGLKRGFWY